jgi:hypothetical protein
MGERETRMLHPQHHLPTRDVGEHDIAQPQSQEPELMTPATPFAVLAERCGLSQREAAEFLKVRIDTVKSWCAGRNVAKPAVLAELRRLYASIQAAGDKLARDNERLLELQRERGVEQRGIVFGVAETDDVARAFGFPSQGPYVAAIGLALSRLPDDVAIVMQPQSYPGTGGGGAAPVVPGTELTWPPSRKASRNTTMGSSVDRVRVRVITNSVLLPNISVPVPQGEYDAYIDWRTGEGGARQMTAVQLIIDQDHLAKMGCAAGIPSMQQEVLRYLTRGDVVRV